MTRTCALTTLVAVAGAAFVAGRYLPDAPAAFAQAGTQPEKKKDAQPAAGHEMDPKMQAAMEKATKPGPEHKVLDSLIGSWKGGGKMWFTPGGEGMPFTGTVERNWDLNNHFVFEEVHGDPMPGDTTPFEGRGVMGYNTLEKRYEFGWVENMNTWISHGTGTYDDKTKTFTFKSEDLDPITGKRRACRTILDTSKPGTHIMTGYCIGADGKEFKNFEGEFTKTK